jgi:phenylalanyl-tRNA synthetase beta chain
MPVITIHKERMETMVKGVPFHRIVERLPLLGLHIEELAESYVKVEYDPNRPDYSTDYGIARSLRGAFSLERGAPKHMLRPSGVKFLVDPSVKHVRPFIAGMFVKGLRLDDETIRQVISMQEDLHEGMGRHRSKLAIGVHNADVVRPPILYKTVPGSFSFTPLDMDRQMTVKQILTELPTGRKYGELVKSHDSYPVIVDSDGLVLSLPPIINGNATKVTPAATNLLIDVTGTDFKVLEDALAIMAESFWDAGAEVQSVELLDEGRSKITPDLSELVMDVPMSYISDLMGIPLKPKEVVDALKRSRFDAVAGHEHVKVTIPRYRTDILHPVDIVEETVYGYGFERLSPDLDFTYTRGSISARTKLVEAVRRVAVGLGLQEVMNFSLSSNDALYSKMRRLEAHRLKVASSKSSQFEYLRDLLLPSLLLVLSENVHEEFPQNIFEVAEVFLPDESSETGVREELHLGAVLSDNVASFSAAKSVLDAFLRCSFGVVATYKPLVKPFLIDGRGAECSSSDGFLGFVGEVHPAVVVAFGLRNPVAAFEVDLTPFYHRVSVQERV